MRADAVALLGYGQFGAGLAGLLREAGRPVRAFDPVATVPDELAAPDLTLLTRDAAVVVVAVPVAATRSAVTALRPHVGGDQLVVEVGSVKVGPAAVLADVFGTAVPWAATHPLFGPASLALGERPLRVVVCPSAQHPGAAAAARAFWESLGCEVVEQSAEEHDRVMAETHALTLFLAKGMLEVIGDRALPFTPPSFKAIERVIDTVRADAGHLFGAIARHNPFAAGARRRLLDALASIDAALAATPVDAGPALDIAALATRNPVLRETRDLIDDLDGEIVALLARRAQLARRAGRIKAASGRPVRDPEREQALLAARRAWAERAGLDPEATEPVWQAILHLGRQAQGDEG